MAESTSSPPLVAKGEQTPVVVKKYANRRLYNTESSSYITLENLAEMIRGGRDFVVYDAKTGEDITRGVLTQIIVEEESKGSALLPTAFLRQLIGFYGSGVQGVVPRYLEQAMSSFARQHQQLRQTMQQTFNPFVPFGIEELRRQNLAMIERAMSLFNPFARPAEPLQQAPPQLDPDSAPEIERLHQEIESLRSQLAVARAEPEKAQGAQDAGAESIEAPASSEMNGPRAARPRKGPG